MRGHFPASHSNNKRWHADIAFERRENSHASNGDKIPTAVAASTINRNRGGGGDQKYVIHLSSFLTSSSDRALKIIDQNCWTEANVSVPVGELNRDELTKPTHWTHVWKIWSNRVCICDPVMVKFRGFSYSVSGFETGWKWEYEWHLIFFPFKHPLGQKNSPTGDVVFSTFLWFRIQIQMQK